MAVEAKNQTLSTDMLFVFKEKRPATCFLCLGEESLLFKWRVYLFVSPGDLTNHF